VIDRSVAMMEQEVLQRLARAVFELRGDCSQRDLAVLLEVAQSTIQGWENARNVPNLENLEKLAKLRGQLPEEFVAFLYGRMVGFAADDDQQVSAMNNRSLALLLRLIADVLEQ
jgi:transcriptional regulator with XRE-family HTH domain